MTDIELQEKTGRLRAVALRLGMTHYFWDVITQANEILLGYPSLVPRLRVEATISDLVADNCWRFERAG